MNDTFNTIRANLPNAKILPTIGNNDVQVKNSVPCTEENQITYYGDLFEVWFPVDHTPEGMDRYQAKETFMHGGYYRYDIPNTDMTVLALNSMFFKEDNPCAFGDGADMLDWFEA